ncbi:MAG: NUDIX domain-containing protein [Nanoarchaeota archaeon]|nr:NUDIX domain-containing protein [Nanoarchaeota archaeon]
MDNNLLEKDKMHAIVLGIIFDPAEKKILIGKRENDPNLPNLSWCFPGGILKPGDEVDKTLKAHVKAKTGYDIKNLGAIFSKIYDEKEDLLAVYFLTQVFAGEENPGGNLTELKWVSPTELETYFTTSFNKKLQQYLLDLI